MEPAELVGIQLLEMYPIQSTDLDKSPYGYRALIYATRNYTRPSVRVFNALGADWFSKIAIRKLRGLPAWGMYDTFDYRECFHQCFFSSPDSTIMEKNLQLHFLAAPRARVKQFIEATRL